MPVLHTAQEDLAFFTRVTHEQSVVVCEDGDAVLGFAAWASGWLNHLYVEPGHQRRHVGRQLLTWVTDRNEPFQLWTFQRNFGARRFYEVHGLAPVEFTGGDHNEEHEPDIRYQWPG
jgi:GNAT superfamily N-acetyltransferase